MVELNNTKDSFSFRTCLELPKRISQAFMMSAPESYGSMARCQNEGCKQRVKCNVGHSFCVPHAACMRNIFDPSMCESCNRVINQLEEMDDFDEKYKLSQPLIRWIATGSRFFRKKGESFKITKSLERLLEPYRRPRIDDRIAAAQQDKPASVVTLREISPSAVITSPVPFPSRTPSAPPRDIDLPTPLYPMTNVSSTVVGSDLSSPAGDASMSLGQSARTGSSGRSGSTGFSGWGSSITPGQRHQNPLADRLKSPPPPGFLLWKGHLLY